MSEALRLADKLNSLCVAEFAWPHLNDAATELRRLAGVEAGMQGVRDSYDRACKTVALMHAAAVGEMRGPTIGVVEDVEAVRAELQQAREERTALLATEQNLMEELAALRAAVPDVPEGWRLVPVVPTQGMCDAAVALKEYDQRRGALSVNSNIYRAMLESSPQAPQAAQPVQPSEQVRKPLSDAEIVLTASDVASLVCRSVAEIPDRNSPEDFPDAMLVTANELHGIVLDAITEWVDASAHNIREN